MHPGFVAKQKAAWPPPSEGLRKGLRCGRSPRSIPVPSKTSAPHTTTRIVLLQVLLRISVSLNTTLQTTMCYMCYCITCYDVI